jgi:hypothetical protein
MSWKRKLKRVLVKMDWERKLGTVVEVLVVLGLLVCQYRIGVEGVKTHGYPHPLDPAVAL